MPQRHLEERSLDKYFDSIRDLPLLTAEEERIFGRKWQNDRNPEGLRMLVEGNLRFVALVGLVPLLTAAVGYCPLYSLLGLRTRARQKQAVES